jgi:isoquinoline 1-oxidoreductase subunit beta
MSRVPANRFKAASQGLSRRTFVTASLATGGGLLLSLKLPLSAWGAASAASPVEITAFVQIDRDSKVHLTMPYIEMGQGTYTSISMLIAEELEVDLAQVRYQHAPPNDKHYANPLVGFQMRGGSTAIRAAWQPMREAGAAARMMLISAAASHWGVDETSCQAAKGAVIHVPTNRRLSFGDLAEKAAMLPVPDNVQLKDPKEFTLIG